MKTLQHFDSINLLSPKRSYNGYREYDEDDITRLKSILFFRELDFPLKEIARILDSENFDRNQVLADQIKLLKIKRDRINSIIELAKTEIGDNNMKT
ncbi:MAG: MerR family transcriptional regulator, partial [Sphaerochaetaceae bacterium]|nr:MerR family transcriptional regulator [Sphaerochaetaceae bacterium]